MWVTKIAARDRAYDVVNGCFFFSSRRRHTRSSTVSWARDVYKRQDECIILLSGSLRAAQTEYFDNITKLIEFQDHLAAVSYTHLTLPTIYSV